LTTISPAALTPVTARRLGEEFARAEFVNRDSTPAERVAAAQRWIDEVFAPLTDPSCREVLIAAGAAQARHVTVSETAFAAGRPLAAPPRAREILIPRELPPQTADEVSQLKAFGLLPYEVALAGECARVVGATRAGPPPVDPLSRLTRAARLEGAARLAGFVLVARGARLEPAQVGLAALSGERDEAGLPRRSIVETGLVPVQRAMLRTFFEDGLRWALFHYLKGGFGDLLAALERPAEGPETLLRPGVNRPRPAGSGACRLGPRGAAALLTGQDETDWVDRLVADRWESEGPDRVVVRLWFEDEAGAIGAQDDLSHLGLVVQIENAVLTAHLRRARPGGAQSP
jgi:hypothetical protein